MANSTTTLVDFEFNNMQKNIPIPVEECWMHRSKEPFF